MELMHKGSLRDLCTKKGSNLPWEMRLKFAISAAKGISYLHRYQIIHRDIKPQNLLVNSEWKCKVADFGISTSKVHSHGKMTVIGTPIYMAPEIFNDEEYTEKVDVYAFGILLYELYSGVNPYYEHEDLPQSQLLLQICNGLRPDTNNFPSTLKQLLEDCWSSESKLRPTFFEIIVRLRRLRNITLPTMQLKEPIVKNRWHHNINIDIQTSDDEDSQELDSMVSY